MIHIGVTCPKKKICAVNINTFLKQLDIMLITFMCRLYDSQKVQVCRKHLSDQTILRQVVNRDLNIFSLHSHLLCVQQLLLKTHLSQNAKFNRIYSSVRTSCGLVKDNYKCISYFQTSCSQTSVYSEWVQLRISQFLSFPTYVFTTHLNRVREHA